VIFSPIQDLVYLRAHFQEPPTLKSQDLKWIPLNKILNRKIIIIHFQNQIIDAKTRLQKEFDL